MYDIDIVIRKSERADVVAFDDNIAVEFSPVFSVCHDHFSVACLSDAGVRAFCYAFGISVRCEYSCEYLAFIKAKDLFWLIYRDWCFFHFPL